MTSLAVDDLVVCYGRTDAVKGISFDIPEDSTMALVGESGSGKSVTSLAILGLLPPENSIVDPKNFDEKSASTIIPISCWTSQRLPILNTTGFFRNCGRSKRLIQS